MRHVPCMQDVTQLPATGCRDACRDGPSQEQERLVAVPRGLRDGVMREARTGGKLLSLLKWARGWYPGFGIRTLWRSGVPSASTPRWLQRRAQGCSPGGGGRGPGTCAFPELPSGGCVLACPRCAVNDCQQRLGRSACVGCVQKRSSLGPCSQCFSLCRGSNPDASVQAAVLPRRRHGREGGAQLKTSSRALSARWETSPQPTRLRPPGVHSRRLMAALPSSQVRGACRSWCVARR